MQHFQRIIYEKKDRVAIITINRPDSLNAIDFETSQELTEVWSDFRDNNDLWVAILTGSGDRAFSSGFDLRTSETIMEEGLLAMRRVPFGGITKRMEIYKPMIAAINGYALGGGLEMALACDLRIAAEHATFGVPEIRWSLIPGAGALARLPLAIPLAKAMEMILMGHRISAEEALHYGLINKVVPLAELMPTAMEWAHRICENGPLAVWASKEAAMRGLNMGLDEALFLDEYLFARLMHTQDVQEGPKAFLEKRKPQFKAK